jgi:hypothetical protein
MVIFHGCRLRTSLFIHCRRLQPSGISEPGSSLRPPDIANPLGSIEPRPIALALLDPAQDIVAQELAHFATAVIRPRPAPGRYHSLVIVKVDASNTVLIPAVELPKIEIVGTQMVVNHIENHRETARVRGVD